MCFLGLLTLASQGTAATCVASMAGYMAGLSRKHEHELATVPADQLIRTVGAVDDLPFGATYCIAKRVNQLRVEQAATAWGQKGARVLSISPGVISTPMSRKEIEQGAGDAMQQQLDLSPIHRMGTADDIAAAVEFLASPAASSITGCDLRVDGGVTAAVFGLGLGLGLETPKFSVPVPHRYRVQPLGLGGNWVDGPQMEDGRRVTKGLLSATGCIVRQPPSRTIVRFLP